MSQEIQKSSNNTDLALEPIIHSCSGAVASSLSTLLFYPLENLKTRIQSLQKQQEKYRNKIEDLQKQSKNQQNNQEIIKEIEQLKQQLVKIPGYKELVQQILEKEGPQGLYKGLSALLTGNFISFGLYFYFYELSKKILKADPKNIGQNMIASSLAGMFSCLGTNPFWVINTRLTFAKNNENFIQILVNLVKKEGITSLYKGLQASLFLITNPLIQFTVYEFLKQKVSLFDKKYSFILFFLAGALSKAVATILTFPPQLLRTYQHMDKKSQNQGYIQLVKDILQQDGFQGLFRGLQPKFIQSVSNSAFMLFFYELIFKAMKKIIMQIKQNPAQAIKK